MEDGSFFYVIAPRHNITTIEPVNMSLASCFVSQMIGLCDKVEETQFFFVFFFFAHNFLSLKIDLTSNK